MTPREARHALAADIEATTGQRCYASPPDGAPALGSCVLAPRQPYVVPGTFCSWEVKLVATVVVALAGGQAALDALDDAAMAVVSAVKTSGVSADAAGVNAVGPQAEAQGVVYVTGDIDVTIYIS